MLPQLFNACKELTKKISTQELESVSTIMKQLEELIVINYIQDKTKTLNSIIQRGLHLSGCDWQTGSSPIAIREYVMLILFEMVNIHSEVFATAKPFVPAVISNLCENIFQTYFDQCMLVEQFSKYGINQMELDLEFIEKIFSKFKTNISTNIKTAINEYLITFLSKEDKKSKEDKELKDKIILHALEATHIMRQCFNASD